MEQSKDFIKWLDSEGVYDQIEGNSYAASIAWDYQQERIDAIEAELLEAIAIIEFSGVDYDEIRTQ